MKKNICFVVLACCILLLVYGVVYHLSVQFWRSSEYSWVFKDAFGQEQTIFHGNATVLPEEGWSVIQKKRLTGSVRLIFANEKTYSEYNVTNGLKQGKAFLWNEHGIMLMSANYVSNHLDGLYQTWHDNGTLASKTFYSNGLESGEGLAWHDNGGMASKHLSIDGKLVGRNTSWDEQSRLIEDIYYDNNMVPTSGVVCSGYDQEGEPILYNITPETYGTCHD